MPTPSTPAGGKTGPAPVGPAPAGSATGGYATPPANNPVPVNSPGSGGFGGVYNPLNLHNVDKSFRDPKGFVYDVLGMDPNATPDNYDAKGQLAYSQGMSASVYNEAMRQKAINDAKPAPQATISAQTIAAPGAINAQTINTPGIVGGAEADALRARQLQQAETAANSPSSAAAQMRAAGGQIENQQLGMAAAARGADRGAARRDAMLAMGSQGQVAANQSAALAAQEQAAKQQAYTQALSGVRSGDVSTTQAQTQIGAANQGANLQAQQATAGNTLTAAQANQGANLQAQMGTANTQLAGWTAQNQAQNAALGTGLQAVGATNQAQQVASGYGQSQNQAQSTQKAGIIGAAGSIIGGILSDERAKFDISTVGADSPYSSYAPSTSNPSSPYFTGMGKDTDFLAWKPEAPKAPEQNKGLLGNLSDERAKVDIGKATHKSIADKYGSVLQEAYGHSAMSESPYGALSDERAKREVQNMSTHDVEQWAEDEGTDPITWRYKPGFEDGGQDVHLGVSAQRLERSGPLGRLMVHRDPETGMRKVDYGALALMLSKAALEKATRKEAR